MNDLWLKIRIWTKALVFALVLVYLLVFLLNNTGQPPVKLWFWFGREPTVNPLLLAFVAFVLGAIVALLVRAAVRTVRQMRELQARGRTERLEREVADMKAKAAMLQTRTPPPSAHVESDL